MNKKKPSYIIIKEDIEKQISLGVLNIGDKLPSELDMAQKYGVSRETFRSATKLLEEDGKIFIKRGVGTFITSSLNTIPNSLDRLTSITEIIKGAGMKEGEKLEKVKTIRCDEEYAEYLNINEGDPVIHHERIRTAEDEPIVYSINIIPKSIVGSLFEEKKLSGSLLYFIEKECNLKVSHADAQIKVPLHTDPYCQKLLIHPHTTVLLMKQIHYDEINRPVFYSIDYLRNDVHKFWIRRKR